MWATSVTHDWQTCMSAMSGMPWIRSSVERSTWPPSLHWVDTRYGILAASSSSQALHRTCVPTRSEELDMAAQSFVWNGHTNWRTVQILTRLQHLEEAVGQPAVPAPYLRDPGLQHLLQQHHAAAAVVHLAGQAGAALTGRAAGAAHVTAQTKTWLMSWTGAWHDDGDNLTWKIFLIKVKIGLKFGGFTSEMFATGTIFLKW